MKKIHIILFCVLCVNSTFYGMKRHLDTIDISEKKCKFSNEKDENLLHSAVRIGDLESTKQLLDSHTADIDSIHLSVTALKIAIEQQHIPMIELLLSYNPQNKCFLE